MTHLSGYRSIAGYVKLELYSVGFWLPVHVVVLIQIMSSGSGIGRGDSQIETVTHATEL
jgi:hypothetical protein